MTSTPLGHTHPAVCVVFICHDGNGRILLGRRGPQARDEHGTWDCGGGAFEHGETFEQAVTREVYEEYGATARDIEFLGVNNVIRSGGSGTTHWVALVHAARVDPAAVDIRDTGEVDAVGWYTLGALPTPLHSQLVGDLELYVRRYPAG